MRILRDFKLPDFKFPKFKMEGLDNIEEMKVDLEKKQEEMKNKKPGKNYEPTTYQTIKEVFKKSTEEYKDLPFILEKFNHKDEQFTVMTYGRFKEDVIHLGTGLNRLLNLKDKRVVIIGENTYYWYVSYMAMLCGVGIAVPVDKELPENEIENVIHRSRAEAVIYSTKKKDAIKKIRENVPEVNYFIQMNDVTPLQDKDVGIEYVIKQGEQLVRSGDNSYMDIKIDPDEFKVLIFTSGTTSQAKGVMICNRNLAENINAVSAYVKLYPSDRLMSILPLHHTYESTIGFLLPMATGSSIGVCEGLKYIQPNMKELQPTALLTVPLLVETLYKKIDANIKKSKKDGLVKSMIHVTNALKAVGIDIKRKVFKEIYDNLGGKIRIIVSAAAPIDAKIGRWVQDIGINFLQGYGLTETSPIAALTPEFEPKVGSAGKPVICAEIKIDNPNENGEGEVLIKSKTLMLGYYENEEATNEVLKDGWFYTGDLARIDEEGYIFICGRKKSVIVLKNGKNIFPEEMEGLINRIEGVKESFIFAKANTTDDENDIKIYAKIVYDRKIVEEAYKVHTDTEIYNSLNNQVKQINQTLPLYKRIRGIIITEKPLIKTTTSKIKRQEEIKTIKNGI